VPTCRCCGGRAPGTASTAVTAADEPGLRDDMAQAITGLFADWVLVDLRLD
jgi:hypothetical protein